MAGKKRRSGGSRAGAGAKKKSDLAHSHSLIDQHMEDADWASIIGALVKKAKRGNVQAFRELRACRFGHIPLATEPPEDDLPPIRIIEFMKPCTRKHADETNSSSEPSGNQGGEPSI